MLPISVIIREVEKESPGSMCWVSMTPPMDDLFVSILLNGNMAKITLAPKDRELSLQNVMDKIRPHLMGLLDGAT